MAKLQKGQIAPTVQPSSGDGYYIVRLVNRDADRVQYEYIHVLLSEFNDQISALEKDGKLNKFITISEDSN